MAQPGAQAIVFGTNAHTGLIKSPCCAQHGGAADSMAEFSSAVTYSACAAEPGGRPLAVLLPSQFRPQASDMACGLVRSTFRYAS